MALLELATERKDIVCIGADLTRQTETDIFRDAIPERFINVGMAEANMIGIAGAMARAGNTVFVNTFGVFCTRRCFDQIAMAVAYPNVNVKIVGFMPGLSSPGGPSHQAIDDIALMRSLPNMTIVDVVDEAPRIFRDDHQLLLEKAQVLRGGKESDVCLIASGMMLPTALSASSALERVGLTVTVVHVPVIKPLDHATVAGAASKSRLVVTADNHNVIGGLGSAVAEAMAEHAVGVPLRRMGVKDVFAESGSREYLFHRYGLGTQAVLDEVWRGLGRGGAAPVAPPIASTPGAYAPV
jgi:transketolase